MTTWFVITITKIKPIKQTDALFTYRRFVRENGTNKIIENLRAFRTLRSVTAALGSSQKLRYWITGSGTPMA